MRLCECGCGLEVVPEFRIQDGRPKRFVHGHNGRIFSSGHEVDPATGCWNWLGYIKDDGYPGTISWLGRHFKAHQVYFIRARGEVPAGLQLDHLCRNRRCVNPDHLEPVTAKENKRRSPHTKLTIEDAREIRHGRARGKDLAARFGVAETTISNIRHGRAWKDA